MPEYEGHQVVGSKKASHGHSDEDFSSEAVRRLRILKIRSIALGLQL